MKRAKKLSLLSSVITLFYLSAHAGDSENMEKMIQVMKLIRSMSSFSYHYEIRNIFPGSQVQSASGDASMDLPRKMLYEKGNYSTTVVNDKWYYKAEHPQKLVSVIYLPHQDQKKQLSGLLESLSPNTAFMPDSVIRRYGRILSITTDRNIVSIKMKFRNLPELESYELVFDMVKMLPVSLWIRTWASGFGGNTVQEVRCSRFRKELPADCFSVQPWFEIKEGKVVLKQYKNYQRHIEL